MKINILKIPEEGLEVHFSLDGESLSGLMNERDREEFSFQRVEVSGSVKKMRRNVFFAGHLETTLEAACCRCLETARLNLNADFRYTLLPEAEAVKDEMELKDNDLEVGYYSGEVIDLEPIIVEQIMLQIPMKVLCENNCKGLCPQCGTNLNMGTCSCRREAMDERLSALKNLKIYSDN